jgi:D-alanyl-D-alanine endopeptidase (penicillin-binding protein 7)
VLAEEHAFTPFPIASLTKIMSAMVALDQHPDLAQGVGILPAEYSIRGGNLRLDNGERVTVRDLLFASLTGSANNAAFALPRALGMSDEAFLEEMRRKAVALGLESFRFVDAAGLSPENVGSAYDMARLAAHALAHYPLIAEAMAAPEYRVVVQGSGREHIIRNSNPLLGELGPRAESKTGYLNEALHCLVLTRAHGTGRLVAVLLGHPDEYGVIREADALLNTANNAGPGSPTNH